MIELSVPGKGILQLVHLVCDVNGTLVVDGRLIEGVASSFERLRGQVEIHMITAGTHGKQSEIDRMLNLKSIRLKTGDEAAQKAAYIRELGSEWVVAVGQGANDEAMLREAALGICILSQEGTAVQTLLAADLVAPDIITALDLLEKPMRIVATLRK